MWNLDLTDDDHIIKGPLPMVEKYVGLGCGTAGSDEFMKLREGIERFMITGINKPGASAMAQSELPTMWDYVMSDLYRDGLRLIEYNHIPGGSNVLYMDGHVKFVKYTGNKWPAHAAAANALGIL